MTSVIATAAYVANAANALCGAAKRFVASVMMGVVWLNNTPRDRVRRMWSAPNPSVVYYQVGGGLRAISTHPAAAEGLISKADCDALYNCLTGDGVANAAAAAEAVRPESSSPATNDFFHTAGGYFFAAPGQPLAPDEYDEDATRAEVRCVDEFADGSGITDFPVATVAYDAAPPEETTTEAEAAAALVEFMEGIDFIVNPLTRQPPPQRRACVGRRF
jgi:hypothetical protein